MMILSQLLLQIRFPFQVSDLFSDPEIRSIQFDTRKIRPGDIFVALKGVSIDGHRFIVQAVEKGAACVVGSDPDVRISIPYVLVNDTRPALAWLCAALEGWPARKMTIIGVTGTDGKTTTSSMIFQILRTAGMKVGMISTVSAIIGDANMDTGFHTTTPDAPDTQQYLAKMYSAGTSHVVLEATSHGLAQDRVTGCEFDIGVVTNITHEHLDYHGNFKLYRDAKARMFQMLAETEEKKVGNPRLAVLNRDDQSYSFLNKITSVRKVTYSIEPESDVWAEEMGEDDKGVYFTAATSTWRVPVHTNLAGDYNIHNALAAISATVFGLGIDPIAAARGIANLTGVPGRMERIEMGQDITAIVDFAHTPFALESVLKSARKLTKGRLIIVFGSAGLRDREKRRMMAEISVQLADLTIITAEDPRTESLGEILREMVLAAADRGGKEGKTLWKIPDRGDAIRLAMNLAEPGDIVLACGKGHEQSMCFGHIEYPWDDRTAMRAAIAERMGYAEPKMPYLPSSDKELDSWLSENIQI